jgi:hypothetical protein
MRLLLPADAAACSHARTCSCYSVCQPAVCLVNLANGIIRKTIGGLPV